MVGLYIEHTTQHQSLIAHSTNCPADKLFYAKLWFSPINLPFNCFSTNCHVATLIVDKISLNVKSPF